ncbi:RagB/SusD family nutrient uptake outer membrane protein [uncultured Chitinophaga sp.]|jgi:SusD family.|uniref:RagB/SusD family nutrient uptake outer membrane protein n=1 Tax=uncultured Chitinophaga sp. TaxID=339340 RepID=UPI0026097A7D|nr:RagB/SusD family nutrient uptake outer membrane protein [uncultured Chitinophaga sp.]
MQKYIYLITAALTFTVTGCQKDFLNTTPNTELITDVAFDSPDGLEGAVVGLYNYVRNEYQNGATLAVAYHRSIGDDLTVTGSNFGDDGAAARGVQLYNSELDANNGVVNIMWDQYYRTIKRANLIIDRADKVGFTDEARKNRLIAEARWFRAFVYFYLVQKYEHIPLVSAYTDEIQETATPASPADVYALIVGDLTFAIDHLERTYPQAGRITKGAAQHALAKVQLVLQNWTAAAALADDIINNGPYQLEKAEDLFMDTNENNAEGIMVWQFRNGEPNGAGHNLGQVFVPLYDRINGVSRSFAQGGRPYGRIYANSYLFSLYEENDKRLQSWYKRYWFYDVNTPDDPLPAGVQIGDTVKLGQDPTITATRIAATCRKFWDQGNGTGRNIGDAASWTNIMYYRLGETYLIAAEAYMRLGNTGTALERINVLRDRAGVPHLTTLNQDILLDENARELALEGHRWFDLKRMGVLIQRIKAHNTDAVNIQPYHVRWPIPQTFKDLARYPQNEGYQ